jgi:regulator of sigma E protease
MTEILGSIWWLLVTLGVLITFHEFGHFWVARKLGVGVLKFSVGFGRPIWSRRGKDGTLYIVAAIPLGGYVKMVDEREGEVAEQDLDKAFNRKPIWTRIAIVAAGPVANLIFAVLAFWLMFMVGIPEARPVIGGVNGIAAEAGIRPGDEIISIDGDSTRTWSHAMLGLVTHALDRDQVSVTVQDARGNQSEHLLDLAKLSPDFSEENTIEAIGLEPWRLEIPAIVGEVSPGSPASEAGIYSKDHIVRIGGEEVEGWSWIGHLVQTHGVENQALAVTIERDGEPPAAWH